MDKTPKLIIDRVATPDYVPRPHNEPRQPRRLRRRAEREAVTDVEEFLRNGGFSG